MNPGAALVTGAARRIGRRLALEAADLGYDVAVHYRGSRGEAQDLVREIRGRGRRATCLDADLVSDSEAEGLLPRAADALGPVTLLVNNASVFEEDAVGSITRHSWAAHIDANLRAPVLLSQAFAAQEHWSGEGAHGLIVNLLDQRVWKPNPLFFSYTVSKAALWAATRTLAQALAPKIRVNGIGPGPTLPNVHGGEAAFEAEARHTPLQRRATPDEIASALRFLVQSPSVTGQMIAVDAGQHLAWRTPDLADG